jgi:hypothetical protein
MRKRLWILVGLAGVVLLGMAAFVAVRLFNSGIPQGSNLVSALSSTPGAKKPGGVTYEVTPAAGIPTGQPDFMATVSEVRDNSVSITATSKLTQGADTVYELVIAQETKLYRDTTGENPPPPTDATSVQETVVQADLSQVVQGDLLAIWGERRGTRWIASTVLIYGPAVVKLERKGKRLNKMKKKIFIGMGAVIGVVLLAGAVFMAVRLINSIASGNGPGILAGLGGGSGNTSVTFMLKLTPAPELPVTHADLEGDVTNIQGNSIFVAFRPNTSAPAGPATEVVVSQKTMIYRDITLDTVPSPQPGTNTSLGAQQVLEPADLSSISDFSHVQVWGQKRGDRMIADFIVVQGTEVVQ